MFYKQPYIINFVNIANTFDMLKTFYSQWIVFLFIFLNLIIFVLFLWYSCVMQLN